MKVIIKNEIDNFSSSKNDRGGYNRYIILLFFITFFAAIYAPATNGSTLSSEHFKDVVKLSFFVLGGIICFFTILNEKIRVNTCSIIMALWPLVYLIYVRLWNYNGIIVGGTSFALLELLYAVQNDSVKIELYKLSRHFIFIMSIVGIICYLTYSLGAKLGYSVVKYYADYENLYYINYRIAYLYKNPMFIRLCGLFNEPGWFGTFLAFYLCAEDLKLRKKSNCILFIAGILSFSLAFYIIIAIYYIGRYVKSLKQRIIFGVVALVYLFVVPNIHTGIVSIDHVLSRIVFSGGHFVGDNRTNAKFDYIFSEFIKTKDIILGKGAGYSSTFRGVSSIKTNIIDYGIVGTLVIYFPLFGAMICKANKCSKAKLYLICTIISMYQRPWIYELSNYILTISAISYISNISYNNTDNNEDVQ